LREELRARKHPEGRTVLPTIPNAVAALTARYLWQIPMRPERVEAVRA
jgi:hypothetical protein